MLRYLALFISLLLHAQAQEMASSSFMPSKLPGSTSTGPWSFEDSTKGWHNHGCRMERSKDQAVNGAASLKLQVRFPLAASIFHEGNLQLDRVSEMRFSVLVPNDAPKKVKVLFYVKDKDGLYFQFLNRGRLKRGVWQILRIRLSENSPDMIPEGHYGQWNRLVSARMNHFGIKLVCDEAYRGPVYIDNIVPERTGSGSQKLQIMDFTESKPKVKVYEKFEISFRLNREFSNPFDPDQVRVDATFRSEVSGKVIQVPGFYYQDYFRTQEKPRKELFRVEEANKELLIERQETLAPVGAPMWKVRFTPIEPGEHSYFLTVRALAGHVALAGRDTLKTQKRRFSAVQSKGRGFVKISEEDPRYFEFDNDEFFYPIGHNVRSPFDERWWVVVLEQDELPPDKGTYTYDKILKKMKDNGENFAEIWMASWWLAIEWTKEWRGFHGLNNYNLEAAWKLDYLLELADKYDMYYHLVLDNHGKGSTWCDPEWVTNPYNAANGGPVEDAEDYFTNREAIDIYKKTLRYLIARWGFHPRIAGFELWSELDLTGNSFDFVGNDSKATWHQEIAGYFKKLDPWDHLVTTHFSTDYSRVNSRIVSLPEIDYVVVDAYRKRGSIIPLLQRTYQVCSQYGKPTFVTEYGGSPWATRADQVIPLLKADLHAGLWSTFMTPTAAPPLLWWFEFIDHQNQYFQFKAFSKFAKGEDRRGKNYQSGRAYVQAAPASLLRLSALTLKNQETAFVWVYDRMAMEQWPTEGGETRFSGVRVSVSEMKAGDYRAEVWNTMTGEIEATIEVTCQNEMVKVNLPEFTTDCALKIKSLDRSLTTDSPGDSP